MMIGSTQGLKQRTNIAHTPKSALATLGATCGVATCHLGTLFGKLPTRHQQGDLNYFQPIPGKAGLLGTGDDPRRRGDLWSRENHSQTGQ